MWLLSLFFSRNRKGAFLFSLSITLLFFLLSVYINKSSIEETGNPFILLSKLRYLLLRKSRFLFVVKLAIPCTPKFNQSDKISYNITSSRLAYNSLTGDFFTTKRLRFFFRHKPLSSLKLRLHHL